MPFEAIAQNALLPSPTKLRGYVFTGVCLSTGGLFPGVCAWSRREDCSWGRGCLVPGVCSGGVPGPGGSAPRRVGIPACTEADPPGETATAADGTHPTGMHSCFCEISIPRGV